MPTPPESQWLLDYRDGQNRARIDMVLDGRPSQQVVVYPAGQRDGPRRRALASLAEGGSLLHVEVTGTGMAFDIPAREVAALMEQDHQLAKAEEAARRQQGT